MYYLSAQAIDKLLYVLLTKHYYCNIITDAVMEKSSGRKKEYNLEKLSRITLLEVILTLGPRSEEPAIWREGVGLGRFWELYIKRLKSGGRSKEMVVLKHEREASKVRIE